MRHPAILCPTLLLVACHTPTAEPGTLRAPPADDVPTTAAEAGPVQVPEAALGCSVDADCAAPNACAVGRCDAGRCVADAAPAGAVCADGACDGEGRCSVGEAGPFIEVTGKGIQSALAVAAMGEPFDHDVIVAGAFDGHLGSDDGGFVTTGGLDGFVTRFNRDGDTLWQRVLGGVGDIYVRDVAVDRDGHAIVAGCTDGELVIDDEVASGVGRDAFVAAFAPDGALLWMDRIGGIGRQCFDHVAVDRTGRVLVAGTFDGQLGLGELFADSPTGFVASFDPAGGRSWQHRISGTSLTVAGLDVAYDDSVYVAGAFRDGLTLDGDALFSLGGEDGFVAKLAGAGRLEWLVGVGGTGDEAITAATATESGVAVGGSLGGVMAVGTEVLVGLDGASFVAGLDEDGSGMWASALEGEGTVTVAALAEDRLSGAVIASGSVLGTFAAAGTTVSAVDEDTWLAKLAYDGTPLWLRHHGGEGAQVATSVAVGDDGRAWLAGYTDDPNNPSGDGYDATRGWLASFDF